MPTSRRRSHDRSAAFASWPVQSATPSEPRRFVTGKARDTIALVVQPIDQQPQQTGMPFIIMQQVQPDFIMAVMQAQHA
jgi:hypothetical protein